MRGGHHTWIYAATKLDMKDNKSISGPILSTFELRIPGELITQCCGSSEEAEFKSYSLVIIALYKNGITAIFSKYSEFRGEKKKVDTPLCWYSKL